MLLHCENNFASVQSPVRDCLPNERRCLFRILGYCEKDELFTGKVEFENIPNYPNPRKFANVNFIMAVVESIIMLMSSG